MLIRGNERYNTIIEEANNPHNVFGATDPFEREIDYDSWMSNYTYVSTAIITFFIKVRENKITTIKWRGSGSSYSIAFASYLSQVLFGLELNDALNVDIAYVETKLGMTWPNRLDSYSRPALNALFNTIEFYLRNHAAGSVTPPEWYKSYGYLPFNLYVLKKLQGQGLLNFELDVEHFLKAYGTFPFELTVENILSSSANFQFYLDVMSEMEQSYGDLLISLDVVGDYYSRLRGSHPKFDITIDEVAAYRNLKNLSSNYLTAYNYIISNALRYFPGSGYGVAHDASTYLISDISTWDLDANYQRYSYLLSGTTTYSDRLIDLAECAMTWTTPTDQTVLRDPVRQVALIYDVCYDLLTPTQRSNFRDFIDEWGNLLYDAVTQSIADNGLYLGPTSKSSIARFIAVAVIMKDELDSADTWLTFCINYLTQTLEGYYWPHYSGQSDGGLGEGIGYGFHGMSQHLEGFEAMYKLGYLDMWTTSQFIQNVGDFFLYTMSPHATVYGLHGDSGMSLHINSYSMANRFVVLWLSQIYSNSYWRWWVDKKYVNFNPDDAATVAPFNRAGLSYAWNVFQVAIREYLNPISSVAPTTLPSYKLWDETGYLSLHSDLSDPDNDCAVNIRYARPPLGAAKHAQADSLSYVLSYKGKPLALNIGYYGGTSTMSWDGPYYQYYGRHTIAKNMFIFENYTTLASDITESQTSITLVDGSIFPPSSSYYVITIWDAVTYQNPGRDPNMERITVQTRSGNVLTVLRSSLYRKAHTAGDRVTLFIEQSEENSDQDIGTISSLVDFEAGTGYQYFVGDATAAYTSRQPIFGATRVRRHFLFVSNVAQPYLCIVDEAVISSPFRMRNMLHTVSQGDTVASVFVRLTDPSVDNVNKTATLAYSTERALVSWFSNDTLNIYIDDESEIPCKYRTAYGEAIINNLGETVKERCTWDWHIYAQNDTPSTSHIMGSVVFPYTDGDFIPDIGCVIAGDTITFTIGSDIIVFTVGTTPGISVSLS